MELHCLPLLFALLWLGLAVVVRVECTEFLHSYKKQKAYVALSTASGTTIVPLQDRFALPSWQHTNTAGSDGDFASSIHLSILRIVPAWRVFRSPAAFQVSFLPLPLHVDVPPFSCENQSIALRSWKAIERYSRYPDRLSLSYHGGLSYRMHSWVANRWFSRMNLPYRVPFGSMLFVFPASSAHLMQARGSVEIMVTKRQTIPLFHLPYSDSYLSVPLRPFAPLFRILRSGSQQSIDPTFPHPEDDWELPSEDDSFWEPVVTPAHLPGAVFAEDHSNAFGDDTTDDNPSSLWKMLGYLVPNPFRRPAAEKDDTQLRESDQSSTVQYAKIPKDSTFLQESCSVCLQEFQEGQEVGFCQCETVHPFCAQCIRQLRPYPRQIGFACPLCRKQVRDVEGYRRDQKFLGKRRLFSSGNS